MSDLTLYAPDAGLVARLIAGVRSYWAELDADAETRTAQLDRYREVLGSDTDEHEVQP